MSQSGASTVNPRENHPVRLACVKHAASVYPEPGSNSQKRFCPCNSLNVNVLPFQNLLLGFDSFSSEYSLCSTLLNCLKRIFGVVIIILLLKYSHRFRRNRRFVTKSQTQNAKHFQGCVADLLDYSVIKVPTLLFLSFEE